MWHTPTILQGDKGTGHDTNGKLNQPSYSTEMKYWKATATKKQTKTKLAPQNPAGDGVARSYNNNSNNNL